MNGEGFANQRDSIYSYMGLREIRFPVRKDRLTGPLRDQLERACKAIRALGLAAGWDLIPPGDLSRDREILFLAESRDVLEDLLAGGYPAAALSHDGNREEDLSAAAYLIEEPEWVDLDSWTKIWQRQVGLPWTILETERLLVREFTPEDMEAIRGLYDPEAVRFLEPPGPDLERERQSLKSYIDKIYAFYGYGHWAVICKRTGDLIGRSGFAVTGRQEDTDASFGYLTRADYRGLGLTMEVCRAMLAYGRDRLGFHSLSAQADPENAVSVHMLKALGFTEAGTKEGMLQFRLDLRA